MLTNDLPYAHKVALNTNLIRMNINSNFSHINRYHISILQIRRNGEELNANDEYKDDYSNHIRQQALYHLMQYVTQTRIELFGSNWRENIYDYDSTLYSVGCKITEEQGSVPIILTEEISRMKDSFKKYFRFAIKIILKITYIGKNMNEENKHQLIEFYICVINQYFLIRNDYICFSNNYFEKDELDEKMVFNALPKMPTNRVNARKEKFFPDDPRINLYNNNDFPNDEIEKLPYQAFNNNLMEQQFNHINQYEEICETYNIPTYYCYNNGFNTTFTASDVASEGSSRASDDTRTPGDDKVFNRKGIELKNGFECNCKFLRTGSQLSFFLEIHQKINAFYKEQSLLHFMQQFFNLDDNIKDYLQNAEIIQKKIKDIATINLGCRDICFPEIETGYSSSQYIFNYKGKTTTIKEYYESRYNLQGCDLLCKEKTNYSCLIPANLLLIPAGQRLRADVLSSAMNRKIQLYKLHPFVYRSNIISFMENSGIVQADNELLNVFGINMEPTLYSVQAEVLYAPAICYGNTVEEPGNTGFVDEALTHRPQQYFRPSILNADIAVIILDNAISSYEAKLCFEKLMKLCSEYGLRHSGKVMYFEESSKDCSKIESYINKTFVQCQNTGFFVFIGRRKNDAFRDTVLLYENTVPTLYIVGQTLFQCEENNTHSINLAMRINLKLGGINCSIMPPEILKIPDRHNYFNNKMFIGLNMYKPNITCNEEIQKIPSVIGMAFTNKFPAQLEGSYWYQESSYNIIVRLREVTMQALYQYTQHMNELPTEIILYRCGYSPEDVNEINEEIEQIDEACSLLAETLGMNKPKIIYILLKENQNMWLFQESPHYHKVSPGTVLFNDLLDSKYKDFILKSTNTLSGINSMPYRYTILRDDYNTNIRTIAYITYWLCFTDQGTAICSKQPYVLQQAHDLSVRGNTIWKSHINYQEDATKMGYTNDINYTNEYDESFFERKSVDFGPSINGHFW